MMQRLSQALRFTDPEALNELNTTNAKAVLGHRLTVGTAFVCAVTFIVACLDGGKRSLDLAETILFYWLGFLAAYLGIGVLQFGVKRGTDRETKVQVAQAKAQASPPPVVVTGERPAVYPPTAEMASGTVEPGRPRPTGDARVDDERGIP